VKHELLLRKSPSKIDALIPTFQSLLLNLCKPALDSDSKCIGRMEGAMSDSLPGINFCTGWQILSLLVTKNGKVDRDEELKGFAP
jgi:hypothetical protein